MGKQIWPKSSLQYDAAFKLKQQAYYHSKYNITLEHMREALYAYTYEEFNDADYVNNLKTELDNIVEWLEGSVKGASLDLLNEDIKVDGYEMEWHRKGVLDLTKEKYDIELYNIG